MIIIGSDHAGFELKQNIKEYLESLKIDFIDVCGNLKDENDDYPDIAYKVCYEVLKDEENYGIAICGTGIGISIACNKVRGIRAANCVNEKMSKFSRLHNNANILCFGARLDEIKDFENVKKIINEFLSTEFESGRHIRRIQKIEGDNI